MKSHQKKLTNLWAAFLVVAILLSVNVSIVIAQSADANLLKQAEPVQAKGEQLGEYVTDVFEDRAGNLWFGTLQFGVARYDGKSLKYFSSEDGMAGGAITSMAQDKDGVIWFGSHEGISRYDGKTFQAIVWGKDRDARLARVSVDNAGKLWVGTRSGVYSFNGESFDPFQLPFAKWEIMSFAVTCGKAELALQDSQGNYWFKTDGAGAIRYDGKKFTQYTKSDGLCSNTVNEIIEDQRGDLWFNCMQAYQPARSDDGGLCRYDGKKFQRFEEVKGLAKNDLYSLLCDRAGNVWIGATGVGVYRFDGNSFQLFDQIERRDLTWSVGIQNMLQDRDGRMWFGFSGGLFRLENNRIINVTKAGPWPKPKQNKGG